MQRRHAWKPVLAFLGAAILSLPLFIVPATAAPAPSRLDDELSQRLQTTPETGLIPVIVEGAADTAPGAQLSARAQRAEDRVRGSGGHVVADAALLGATVAELTPAQIRALAGDPSVGRIHFDAPVSASAVSTDQSTGGPTPVVFQQTVGAPDAWQAGDTGQGVTVAVLDTGIDDDAAAFGGRRPGRVASERACAGSKWTQPRLNHHPGSRVGRRPQVVAGYSRGRHGPWGTGPGGLPRRPTGERGRACLAQRPGRRGRRGQQRTRRRHDPDAGHRSAGPDSWRFGRRR